MMRSVTFGVAMVMILVTPAIAGKANYRGAAKNCVVEFDGTGGLRIEHCVFATDPKTGKTRLMAGSF
jgi:hypothetical protein